MAWGVRSEAAFGVGFRGRKVAFGVGWADRECECGVRVTSWGVVWVGRSDIAWRGVDVRIYGSVAGFDSQIVGQDWSRDGYPVRGCGFVSHGSPWAQGGVSGNAFGVKLAVRGRCWQGVVGRMLLLAWG